MIVKEDPNIPYTTIIDGHFKEIHGLQSCLDSISERVNNLVTQNTRLQEQVEYLQSDQYKDQELAKMRHQVAELREENRRGFSISESEHERLSDWMEEHGKVHNYMPLGVSGGRYVYHFIPTGIGTCKEVECQTCKVKFDFSEEF